MTTIFINLEPHYSFGTYLELSVNEYSKEKYQFFDQKYRCYISDHFRNGFYKALLGYNTVFQTETTGGLLATKEYKKGYFFGIETLKGTRLVLVEKTF